MNTKKEYIISFWTCMTSLKMRMTCKEKKKTVIGLGTKYFLSQND